MIEIKFGNTGHKVRRFSWQNPFDPRFLCQTVKHPLKLMFWGSFCGHKIGRLHVCEGIMNSDKYINVLQRRLLPFINDVGPDVIYQQDGAPCHTSRKSMNWLKEHNIEVLDWPGNSPDLNPIENLWFIMKRKVEKLGPKTKEELISAVIRVWNHDLDDSLLKRLVCSMPKRINAVIKAKGNVTKYWGQMCKFKNLNKIILGSILHIMVFYCFYIINFLKLVEFLHLKKV